MKGTRNRSLAVLALAAAAACDGEEAQPWIELARAEVHGAAPEGEVPLGEGRTARFEREGDDLWLVTELARESWTAGEAPGRFTAALPIVAVGAARGGGAPYRLSAAERAFPYEPDPTRFGREPGRFSTEVLALELALEPGEEPPARCELRAVVDYQTAEQGRLCVRGRRRSGAGFWVPGGKPRTVLLSIPAERVLRFATVLEPLLGDRTARSAARTFRVRLDGTTLFEAELAGDVLGEACRWHEVVLPRGGVQRARLSFEVEGPPALGAFLAPVLAPRERDTYGKRPWEEARPDVLVFLADTFRADNLAAYGATSGLTPTLDAFAARGRVFARTWATSTHTLPSHSSLFSGVYPHQNGQVDLTNPLPGAVETLAERLGERGYRCGAVSDGVMVSRSHGLDQGFESFDERRETPTLERVREFLDADDGRPVFLFVQTYAVHSPYLPGQETRARLGEELALDRDFEAVQASLAPYAPGGPRWPLPEAAPDDPVVQDGARRLRDLYLAAVAELDELFGAFHAEVERRGLLERGTLFFTSDHGEAFFEHGRPFHTNKVFEEELRVPLIVQGPRFPPGREETAVSLIDFAPTVAELAGLSRSAHWEGRSWLGPLEPRPIYAFQARRIAPPSTLAVIDGTRKIIGFEQLEELLAGRLYAAFDLGEDAAELASQVGVADWPAELEQRYRAELERLLTPLVTSETSSLSGDELRAMQALGYAGPEPER